MVIAVKNLDGCVSRRQGRKPEPTWKANFSKSRRELRVRVNSTKEEIQKFIEFCGQKYGILKTSPYIPNNENSGFHVFVNLKAKESGDKQ